MRAPSFVFAAFPGHPMTLSDIHHVPMPHALTSVTESAFAAPVSAAWGTL
jgi:hypothetical protein